jgi:hypothetical protein
MQLAVAVLVARQLTTQWVEVQSEEMDPPVALLNGLNVSQLVEAQLEGMAPDLCSTHRRRMVLPILAVVAVAPTTELLAVAVQESSLFVILCQLHRLFRHPRQLLALHARVQH